MNITLVTNKLINGGGERVLCELASHLKIKRHGFDILFLGRVSNIDEETCQKLIKNGARMRKWFQSLSTLVKADVVHLYNINVFVKLLPVLLLLSFKKRLICHIHGHSDSANRFSVFLFRTFRRILHSRVYVSSASRLSYDDNGGVVIYNPVLFCSPKSKKSDASNTIRMVSVNRLEAVKDVERQLKIVEWGNNNSGLEFSLDIYGGGSESTFLLQLTKKLGINDYVTFHGPTEHKLILKELPSFDVFISTSKAEGFGISLVEALSANLTCFVNKIPSFEEINKVTNNINFLDSEASFERDVTTIISNYKNRDQENRDISFLLEKEFSSNSFFQAIDQLYTLR